MTLTLFVLRHGKSDWDAACGGDHERPLKKRGVRAARLVGRALTGLEQAPDLVLSSSAVRARTTAELAHDAGGWTCPLEVTRELYQATPEAILERLRALEPSPERVLVVGHEPTLSELVALLIDGARPAFPTAALARIDFELSAWDAVGPGTGTLAWLLPPRLLDEQ